MPSEKYCLNNARVPQDDKYSEWPARQQRKLAEHLGDVWLSATPKLWRCHKKHAVAWFTLHF
jgi:hypothetical protein